MSLRWKLFRFLSVDSILQPSTENTDPETPLFPALTPTHAQESIAKQVLLRRFSTVADRSHDADSLHGLYAFALPRAVVHFFNLSPANTSLCLAPVDPSLLPPTPLQYAFSAHETAVVALALVRGSQNCLPWLVTLGIDENGPSVKVWAFKYATTDDMQPGSPTQHSPFADTQSSPAAATALLTRDDNRYECIAVYRLQNDTLPTSLSVRDAHDRMDNISQIAIGFEDGSVTIFSGDVCRERANRTRVAPAPGEMIEAKPIVFLRYCGDVLYSVSEMSVCVIQPVPDTDKPSFRRYILDNLGVSRGQLCCVLEDSAQLVVARDEALYFFNHEGRGPCLAFPTEGKQASISNAGNYIIHSTEPGSITAYDIVNKLIAYRGKGLVSCSFHGQVDGVRSVLLCVKEGPVLKLAEISLEQRVNMLLKRGLYVSAVGLARAETVKRSNQSKDMLIHALRQYSEYLMTKGRYDEAAEQLVETIGESVEPSWVIMRLVEQSGLRSGLRLYLEALHAAGKAAFVHTKVLITCYRHDRARGAILGSKATEKTTDEYVINVFSDVDWTEDEVDAAIVLCREAGLFRVAERVSRRRNRHVQLARTLVEDMNQPMKALELLRSLPDSDAEKVILACGRQLLVVDPENFVRYLADAICRSTAMMPTGASEPMLQLSTFLPMFIDMSAWRAVLLDKIVKTPGGLTTADAPIAWLLLFESLVNVDVAERLRSERMITTSTKTAEDDARSELDGVSEVARTDVECASTYLSVSRMSEKGERRAIGRRALKILQSRRSVIDLRAALEIAEQYGHDPCLEYLYEHLRMYKELGVCLRISENGSSLLRACRRHGDREAQLWVECIKLFTPLAAKEEYGAEDNSETTDPPAGKSPMGDDRMSETSDESTLSKITRDSEPDKGSAQDVLEEAILALDRSGAMSALEVIDVVIEACPDGPWGLIRDYFERCTTGQKRDATNSEHSGLLLESELKELRKETKRLAEEAVVIKPKTCASCEDAVSLPAVHFFCGHSFHTTCLAPGGVGVSGIGGADGLRGLPSSSGGSYEERSGMWGEECPRCAPEYDAMVSMRQALQEKNTRHDEFFRTLKGSRDGFATIIQFLERSPFI